MGGGLKSEIFTLSTEFQKPETANDTFVTNIQDRLSVVSSSFGLRKMMEEKGRIPQFERVRNHIGKLRNVPRSEVPNVVRVIIPLLTEVVEVEVAPPLLRKCLQECMTEMVLELQQYEVTAVATAAAAVTAHTQGGGGGGGQGGGQGHGQTQSHGQGGVRTSTTAVRTENNHTVNMGGTSLFRPQKTRASGTLKGTGTFKGKTRQINDDTTQTQNVAFDTVTVRSWIRRLGIMYYGGDLPGNLQEKILEGAEQLIRKKSCNNKVDEIVKTKSEKILIRLDTRYKKIIDAISSFLEAQENYFNFCVGKLTDFFYNLGVLVESHHTAQKGLDERNADDLWDLSEEFRLDNEDRELLFQQFCDTLRQSGGSEILKNNFSCILDLLSKIEEDYRAYHGKSCFAADRYPLYLIDEYKRFLVNVSGMFNMIPHATHPVLTVYDQIYDETVRLNKKYFDENPAAGGVEIREEKEEPVKITEISTISTNLITNDKDKDKDKDKKSSKRNSIGEEGKTVKRNNSIRPISVLPEHLIPEITENIYDSPNIVIKKETKVTKRRSSLSFLNDQKSQKSSSEKENNLDCNLSPYAGRYLVQISTQEMAKKLTGENDILEETVAPIVEDLGPSIPAEILSNTGASSIGNIISFFFFQYCFYHF